MNGMIINSSLFHIDKFFLFSPKIEYKSVAERSEANQRNLTFHFWCVYSTKSEPIFKISNQWSFPRATRLCAKHRAFQNGKCGEHNISERLKWQEMSRSVKMDEVL